MRIFTIEKQPFIIDKYKFTFCIKTLKEVFVPDANEIVGTIYAFINKTNNKIYIGQTSTKFYSRWGRHYGDTFTKQDNLYLHNAFRKYGWDNFDRVILWQSKPLRDNFKNRIFIKRLLNIKEQWYIKRYKSHISLFGYNCTSGGTKDYIIQISEETRRKQKEIGLKRFGRPILQFDLQGNFIKEWACIKYAAQALNICINMSGLSSGGYIWIYKQNNNIKSLVNQKIKYKEEVLPSNAKTIYAMDFNGNIVSKFKSIASAAAYYNLSSTNISSALRNNNVFCAGNFIWLSDADLNKKDMILKNALERSRNLKSRTLPVMQIYINGSLVKLWENTSEIIKSKDFNMTSVRKCLAGTLNLYKNCFWIYEKDFSEDVIKSKLENYKLTKKSEVENLLKSSIQCIENKHDTTSAKMYLKLHPTVIQYNTENQIVKIWKDYRDIEKQTKYKFSNISKCLRNTIKTAYNYIWKFA